MKLEEKIKLTKEIEDKISQFKGMLFINFIGLDVKNITKIRREFRKNSFECQVVKNSIIERVLKNLKIEPLKEWLDGPTAICIGNEIISGAKILSKYQREYEKFKIKGGIFDNKVLSLKEIEEIAKIPDYKTLLTNVINNLYSPLNNFIWSIKNLFVNIVATLEEIIKKKGE